MVVIVHALELLHLPALRLTEIMVIHFGIITFNFLCKKKNGMDLNLF